jgi:hypothetical protein
VNDVRRLLELTASIAADYVESLGDRPVFPDTTPEELRSALRGPLPEQPLDPQQVVTELAAAAEPGVVATGSGRYFGFVIGGALPAALAADWLATCGVKKFGSASPGVPVCAVGSVQTACRADAVAVPAPLSLGARARGRRP